MRENKFAKGMYIIAHGKGKVKTKNPNFFRYQSKGPDD